MIFYQGLQLSRGNWDGYRAVLPIHILAPVHKIWLTGSDVHIGHGKCTEYSLLGWLKAFLSVNSQPMTKDVRGMQWT